MKINPEVSGENYSLPYFLKISKTLLIGNASIKRPFFPFIEFAANKEFKMASSVASMVAIKSATIEPAKLLNIVDRLGSIEVGKLADLVVFSLTSNVKYVSAFCPKSMGALKSTCISRDSVLRESKASAAF